MNTVPLTLVTIAGFTALVLTLNKGLPPSPEQEAVIISNPLTQDGSVIFRSEEENKQHWDRLNKRLERTPLPITETKYIIIQQDTMSFNEKMENQRHRELHDNPPIVFNQF